MCLWLIQGDPFEKANGPVNDDVGDVLVQRMHSSSRFRCSEFPCRKPRQ